MPNVATENPATPVAPWLRENGRAVLGAETAKQAMKKAGLDWNVELASMLTDKGAPVPGRKAVVRSSDGAVISTVGNIYQPIQNAAAFELMDSQVRIGAATFDSAGYFDDGCRIWILCKLKGELTIAKDDVVEKYMLLHNSHDGSHRLRAFITPVRVYCKNSLNLALAGSGSDGIAIGHTAKADQQMKLAAEAMEKAATYYRQFDAAAQRMAKLKFTEAKMKALAAHLLPSTNEDEDDEKASEPSAQTTNQRDRILELFTQGMGHKGIEGTAWAAFNAVAEWTDHHRNTRSDENRLRSAWFGRGARLKREAYAFLTAAPEAAAAPKARKVPKAAPAPKPVDA